jgi:hypothetical protein
MFDDGAVDDARELPWRPPRNPVEPKRSAVWIRLDGQWRRGWVRHWERDGAGWAAWTMYQDDTPWTRVGLFAYDPKTIIPKDTDTPPA